MLFEKNIFYQKSKISDEFNLKYFTINKNFIIYFGQKILNDK